MQEQKQLPQSFPFGTPYFKVELKLQSKNMYPCIQNKNGMHWKYVKRMLMSWFFLSYDEWAHTCTEEKQNKMVSE